VPRANPESSVESAARHLFRHIDDIGALRRNPLVRYLVDTAEGGELPRILQDVRNAIVSAVSRSHEECPLPTKRSFRQKEIVAGLCSGESPEQTAARLGISIHHYYRERRAVALSVAKVLLNRPLVQTNRLEITDPLGLLHTHAATLCDQGMASAAVSMLEREIPRSPDGGVRLALKSELARSLLLLGRTDLAVALLDDRLTHRSRTSTDAVEQWANEHCALTHVLLAMERGALAEGATLESLAKSKLRSQRLDEEALNVIIECGTWYCQVGLFDKARTMLNKAREIAMRANHISVRLQSGMALLAAYCAQQTQDEFELEYQWLSEALALSTSNGSIQSILQATAGLMQYHLTAGNDEGAYRLAQEGLRIAQRTDGTRLVEQFGVQIAGVLLRTRYWRAVDPLIFQLEELTRPGSMRWAYLKEFQGLFLMRTSQYAEASRVLTEAYEGGKKTKNPWLEGLALRDLAFAQHRSGRRGDAADLMRGALTLLEGQSGIASLSATYDTAAEVLPERRLARLATQLKAGLRARTMKLRSGTAERRIVSDRSSSISTITRGSLTIGRLQS
jgi:tetratricopeptide (TPR) repeat protein